MLWIEQHFRRCAPSHCANQKPHGQPGQDQSGALFHSNLLFACAGMMERLEGTTMSPSSPQPPFFTHSASPEEHVYRHLCLWRGLLETANQFRPSGDKVQERFPRPHYALHSAKQPVTARDAARGTPPLGERKTAFS